jgi:hypothetical protein
MYKQGICDITIGDYRLREAENIQVESSWDKLTDTCIIKLPRRLYFAGKPVSNAGPWQRGQAVGVAFGYADSGVIGRFEGFITSVEAGTNITLHCEDAMYGLKRGSVSNHWPDGVNLRQLLTATIGSNVRAADVQLGAFKVDNASPAQVLDALRTEYQLPSFYRAGTLYSGLKFWPELQRTHTVVIGRNTAADSLEWNESGSEDFEIEAVGLYTEGGQQKKLSVKVGRPGGVKRTVHFYNLRTTAALEAAGRRELEKMDFTGYRGSVTLFGVPVVRHGDILDLRDNTYREHRGRYLVKAVTSEFGSNGIRQKLELDARID